MKVINRMLENTVIVSKSIIVKEKEFSATSIKLKIFAVGKWQV